MIFLSKFANLLILLYNISIKFSRERDFPMKKLLLASLITLASTPALAIEGGTALNWAEHDNLVRMNCTGTIIGGKFVLTADHCFDEGQKLGAVTLSNNETASIQKYYRPSKENNADVAIWELETTPSVTFFEPLSMMPVVIDDQLQINGFGQAQTTPRKATKSVFSITDIIYDTINIGSGITEEGDSGSPVIKNNTGIVAVHSAGMGANSNEERLNYPKTRNSILDTVNGWHYPTVVKTTTGEEKEVRIQSLFKDEEVIDLTNLSIESSNSGIRVTVNPSCVSYEPRTDATPATSSNVRPFDVCTLNIDANDDVYGTVTIKNNASIGGQDAVITINPQAKPKPQPDNGGTSQPTNNGGSGGSMGILTLIGLLGIALKRKFF